MSLRSCGLRSALLKTACPPEQSGVTMPSFKMRMTGQQFDYFCLHLLIEMAMTYFRRRKSQEKEEKNGITASPTR
jgi:hypothetical protein